MGDEGGQSSSYDQWPRAYMLAGSWLPGNQSQERESALRRLCEWRGHCLIEICDRVIERPDKSTSVRTPSATLSLVAPGQDRHRCGRSVPLYGICAFFDCSPCFGATKAPRHDGDLKSPLRRQGPAERT